MPIVAAIGLDDQTASIVTEGLSLATAYDEPLHVVHAVPAAKLAELQRHHEDADRDTLSGVDTLSGGDTLTVDDVARTRLAEADVVALDDSTVAVEVVGLDGDPATAVIDYAAAVDARYVVIGGRGRSPAGKALFGSIGQSVILDADAAVVVTGE